MVYQAFVMLPVVGDFYGQYIMKCFCWQTNVVSDQVHELILRCVSSVLVTLVHSGCEMNCCAELHVGKENCVRSFEKVNSYREM